MRDGNVVQATIYSDPAQALEAAGHGFAGFDQPASLR